MREVEKKVDELDELEEEEEEEEECGRRKRREQISRGQGRCTTAQRLLLLFPLQATSESHHASPGNMRLVRIFCLARNI